MGQYYYVVNLDKREYLHPHRFGDGLKLMEFGLSGCATMAGLAVLLADGNGRGGGDLHIKDNAPGAEMVGRWAGDRIVIAGDYADEGRWGDTRPNATLYVLAGRDYRDVSIPVILALCADEYARGEFLASLAPRESGYEGISPETYAAIRVAFPSARPAKRDESDGRTPIRPDLAIYNGPPPVETDQ